MISEEYANLDNPIDIWIKFTSYLKPDEAILLENKDVNSIQKNEYLRIKKQLMISRLLLKYKNKDCSKEEYDLVTNYMNSTSLQSLIQTKLTKEEIEYFIKEYIESQQKKFEELSAYESYVLLKAKEKIYNLKQRKVKEQIRIEQVRRTDNLIKGLTRDYGHNF